MATPTAIKQKSYCFPQERPATKQELTQHIKNAMRIGRSYTHEEHTQEIDKWFKSL